MVFPAQIEQFAGVFVAVHAPHRHSGGPGFGISALELVCDLVEGATYHEIGVKQAFASGPQLLDLNGGQLPAPSQVRQHLFAHDLGRFNTVLTFLGRLFSDGCRILLSGPA